jgi:allantoin racemase
VRILLVNANTNQAITDLVAEEARATASPGTEIVPLTGTFGAKVIGSRSENAIAEHAAVELMARHWKGCDAVLIAVSYDTALRAAREMLPIPVVGMTEAALLTACMVGGPIGMLVFHERTRQVYREVAESYGLGSRLAGIRVISTPAAAVLSQRQAIENEVAELATRLAVEDGAESVVPVGAVAAGMPRTLRTRVPVPLLDGISCGVLQAELLARLNPAKPSRGSYAPPEPNELTNVDPAITALQKSGS